jgi:hypothetical protein
MSFLKHIRMAWSDYFEGSPTTTFVPKEYTSTQTLSGASIYISNCLFNKITSSDSGGAFYCSSMACLLIESSSFISCKTSSNGGAFYFTNSNSECVLHKVCGNNCSSTGTGGYQFAYVRVKDTASSKDYICYSSIVRCVNENSNPFSTLYLWYGKICCPSVNLSMNKCGTQTGISYNPFADSNSVTCSVTYSSFADNNSTVRICLQFNAANAKYEIKCCNIIRNTQVDLDSIGTIRSDANLMFEDSCIIGNTATYLFHGYSSYTFTLSNCTVDKTTVSVGSITIIKTITKSFIHALNHMSTEHCSGGYDSMGTLTPDISQIPSSSKKLVCNYSCRPHLRDFISLICVFIFNFVHQYHSTGL